MAATPKITAGKDVVRAFAHGLSQTVSISGSHSRKAFPDTARSAAEALKGDWIKLGGDMRKASAKVIARGR